jgi:hypothetical protein
MKQVRNFIIFVVSGFGMELIDISRGLSTPCYFLPLLLLNKTVHMEMVHLKWNFASAKEILHIFTLLD